MSEPLPAAAPPPPPQGEAHQGPSSGGAPGRGPGGGVPAVNLSKGRPVVRVRTEVPWLPQRFRERAGRIALRFRPSEGERVLFRKKQRLPPSEWAARYRKITYGPLKDAYFDPAFMPHIVGIMDAAAEPCVREIVNCKAPQTGGSACWETFLASRADMAPGDTLIVYPDQNTAKKRCQDYLQPIFTGSPRLRRLLTGVADDQSALRLKLRTELIYMGWAGSVTSIGNVSVRYLLVDELDKCPKRPSKDEAGFEALVAERTTAYDRFGSLKIWNSTPTITPSPIHRKLLEMDVICDYEARCPHCGTRQVMDFAHIDFAGERDPEVMERSRLARYRCDACAALWDDRDRDAAVRDGRWIVRGDGRSLKTVLREERPARLGFHSPAWISPLNPLSKCAAAFLRGLKSRAEMVYFDTQIAAVEHVPAEAQRAEDALMALVDDRPAGLVPGGGVVQGLVCGSDTQDNGNYYWIDAVGWGRTGERWRIRAGFVPTEEALWQVVFGTEYRDAAGNAYPVRLMLRDSGGHRTKDVYDMCRSAPYSIAAYKGMGKRSGAPWTVTRPDRYPGSNIPMPGTMFLYSCDSHHFKNLAAERFLIKPDDPGAWHLDQGFNIEEARQLCAEYRDERGLWQCPSGRANHYWDCAVMALIAGQILDFHLHERPEAAPPRPHPEPAPPGRAGANPFTGGRQMFGPGR